MQFLEQEPAFFDHLEEHPTVYPSTCQPLLGLPSPEATPTLVGDAPVAASSRAADDDAAVHRLCCSCHSRQAVLHDGDGDEEDRRREARRSAADNHDCSADWGPWADHFARADDYSWQPADRRHDCATQEVEVYHQLAGRQPLSS